MQNKIPVPTELWQKDEDVSYCNLCQSMFIPIFVRKHHCRKYFELEFCVDIHIYSPVGAVKFFVDTVQIIQTNLFFLVNFKKIFIEFVKHAF